VKHLLVAVIAVWFVLGGLTLWWRMSRVHRVLFIAGMLFLFPVLLIRVVETVAPRLYDPPIWDVRCFWVWGRIALTSHNIYDPQSSLAIGSTFPYDAVWNQLFLKVGFIYPPPTILLFAPLGFFPSPESAAPFWYAVNLAAMLGAIFVLWGTFLRNYGLSGLLGTAILVTGFGPTSQTLFYGQPLTILLLFIALCFTDGSPLRRGVWLGVAFIVKPLVAPLFLQPLLKRTWTELGAAVSTIAIGLLGAILLVGWQNISPYFTNGPSRRYALSIWLERENISLFSAMLRITHQPAPDSLLRAEPFLVCALVVTLATVYVCIRSAVRDRRAILCMLVALALLIYPPSAGFYCELLLVPILILWSRAGPGLRVPAIAYASAVYAVLDLSTPAGIAAPLSMWLIFGWVALHAAPRSKLRTWSGSGGRAVV